MSLCMGCQVVLDCTEESLLLVVIDQTSWKLLGHSLHVAHAPGIHSLLRWSEGAWFCILFVLLILGLLALPGWVCQGSGLLLLALAWNRCWQ